jgi:hypothetical protein
MLKNDLENALQYVANQTQLSRRPRDERRFRDCVEAWCDLLGWPLEVADLAMQLRPSFEPLLGRVAAPGAVEVGERKQAERLGGGLLNSMANWMASHVLFLRRNAADDANATGGAMLKLEEEHYFYLLFALAVVAVGYVVYRWRQKFPQQKPRTASPMAEPARNVLVLVVNANHEGVIEALRAGGGSALQEDELYKATQALWFGTEADFARLGFAQWFRKDRAVTTPSEYDVHLIRLAVAADDVGFHRNANHMDRVDAFRRLQEAGLKAEVSPRVPSDAYGTMGVFYKR